MNSAAAAIAIRRRRMIRRYRQAGATDPLHARRPEDLRIRRSWLFNRMVDGGVFIPVSDDRCFLDEAGVHRYYRRLRIRVLLFVAVAIAIYLVVA